MSLNYLINDINEVDDTYKSLYEETEHGYKLKVQGVDDFEKKLSNKSKEILTEKKQLQEKLKDYQTQLEKINEEKAKKAGDYESLIKSAEQKRLDSEEKYKQIINKYNDEKKSNVVKDLSIQLCDGVHAKLISPHISSRLDITETGDLVVLDLSGKPTVNTLEDLMNEIKSNEIYSPLLRGTRASGGNATGQGKLSDGLNTTKMSTSSKLNHYFSNK